MTIIVTGSIVAKAGHLEALLGLSPERVHRARFAPGCIPHGVNSDEPNVKRLVLFEEWAHSSALVQHFAVPAPREFLKAATQRTDGGPRLVSLKRCPQNASRFVSEFEE